MAGSSSFSLILHLILLIAVLIIAALIAPSAAGAGDEGDPLLEAARKHWAEKEYGRAVEAYRELRDRFPEHPFTRSGDAQFWLWCSLGNAGRVEEEIREIERFLKDYPDHRSCGYALYFLGTAWQKLDDGEKAKDAWDRLVKEHPDDSMVQYVRSGPAGTATKGMGRRSAQRSGSGRNLGEDFIDSAKGAAAWLSTLAKETGSGLNWPTHEGDEASSLSFYEGASGICLFYLNLFRVTGEAEYGDQARKSAAWLMKRAKKERGGLCWTDGDGGEGGGNTGRPSPALYTGAAGIGQVFLYLHETFKEARYLDCAQEAGDWILATAEREKNRLHWGGATDIISGPAGIGLFLLNLHDATGDKKYLEGARATADWLLSIAVKDGGGLKWKSSLTLDRFYTGFSHGTAGIAFYLARVYEGTEDKAYLEGAEAGAAWLMDRAVSGGEGRNGNGQSGDELTGKGLKWFHYEPDRMESFQTGWCHGPAGTCRLFLKLYEVTGKKAHLDAAKKGAAWLTAGLSPSRAAGLDPDWVRSVFYGLSMCCGAAGIADFYLDLYLATGEEDYLERAAAVARHIAHRARKTEGGFSWTNQSGPDKEGKYYYGTGHMTGAAGIGTVFLKLHAVCNRREHLLFPFPDKPAAAAPTELTVAPYVVLTNLKKNNAYYGAARALAAEHNAKVVPFGIDRLTALRRTLKGLNPRYVALVLEPDDIDVNLHRELIALSTRMDGDPFCDFAFGFITGASGKDAAMLVKGRLKARKKSLPKSAASASVITGSRSYCFTGAKTELTQRLGYDALGIYWASVESDPDVLAFVKKYIKELEGRGLVELYGCGDPEGIWLFDDDRNRDASKHWPFDPEKVGQDPAGEMPRITAKQFKPIRFDGAVVWSGTCHSGVVRRAFVEGDIVSTFGTVDRITEYLVPEKKSLALAILASGPSAYLAPIGANHGYACSAEVYRALSGGMPLGDVMRTRYNEIIFAARGRLDIMRYEPGAPQLREDPMRGGGANRTLFGDPLYTPFEDPGLDYLETKVVPLAGRRALKVTVKVLDTGSGMFWDMFGDDRNHDERIYAAVKLPPGTGEIIEVAASAESPDGGGVTITPPAWALEEIDGKRLVHLQVNAPRESLKKVGTVVVFTLYEP